MEMTRKYRILSMFMYPMNIQNDVIGLVLRENCKSKQVTDFIAMHDRADVTVHLSQINSTFFIFFYYQIELNFKLFRQFPKFSLPESWIYK
jgi:hypothetical protein